MCNEDSRKLAKLVPSSLSPFHAEPGGSSGRVCGRPAVERQAAVVTLHERRTAPRRERYLPGSLGTPARMISPSISEEMIISPSITPSRGMIMCPGHSVPRAIPDHRTTGSGGVHAGEVLAPAKARPRSASSTAIHLTIPAARRSYE